MSGRIDQVGTHAGPNRPDERPGEGEPTGNGGLRVSVARAEAREVDSEGHDFDSGRLAGT